MLLLKWVRPKSLGCWSSSTNTNTTPNRAPCFLCTIIYRLLFHGRTPRKNYEGTHSSNDHKKGRGVSPATCHLKLLLQLRDSAFSSLKIRHPDETDGEGPSSLCSWIRWIKQVRGDEILNSRGPGALTSAEIFALQTLKEVTINKTLIVSLPATPQQNL